MKKILLSAFVVLTFVAYTLHKRLGLDDESSQVVAPKLPAEVVVLTSPDPSGNPTSKPIVKVVRGKYKDGAYTGNVADAYYGDLQVQAIIFGGKISDVVFLQYPNDRKNSIRINTQAMPYLKQEAILAQSSDVDVVSGATQSSRAFRESLKSALSKAQ